MDSPLDHFIASTGAVRPVNAYFIDGGESTDYYGQAERIVDIVIAPNRNRARYLFWLKYKYDLGDLLDGWCESIRLVQKDLSLPEGLLDSVGTSYQKIWEKANEVLA